MPFDPRSLDADQLTLALLVVALIGGLWPVWQRWSQTALHRLVAFAAGTFAGSLVHVSLDLLGGHDHGGPPEPGEAAESAHSLFHAAGEPSTAGLWIAFCAGFVLLAWLDRRFKPRAGASAPAKHQWVWRASFLGLAIHAALAGLGLGGLAGGATGAAWTGFALAFLAHKGVEAFSLGTLMRLAELPRGRASVALIGFATITPLGFATGRFAALELGGLAPLAAAFSAGTFLFVTAFELLPESFHDPRGRWKQALLIGVGVALALLLPQWLERYPRLPGRIAVESWRVFVEMAPYLLFGFLAAGLISTWLDTGRFKRFLSGEGAKPVFIAAIAGAPLPLCSCSVVPVAAALRQAGAGRGPTSAFLIATPETGIDSVATTWGLLGPVMAIARPVAALVSALATGLLVGRTSRSEPPQKRPFDADFPGLGAGRSQPQAACSEAPPAPVAACCAHSSEPVAKAEGAGEMSDEHSHEDHEDHDKAAPGVPRNRLIAALRYGYVRLVDDLAWPLVLGVIASGLIAALVPAEWFANPVLHGPLGYLAMLALGLPIYVCAAASTPVGAMLIAKGLSPGAALVFLLASPATNLGSLLVVRRLLGNRALSVHLGMLSLSSLFLGWAFDQVLRLFDLSVASQVADHQHTADSPWAIGAALVLAGLLLASFKRSIGGQSAAREPESISAPGPSASKLAASHR